MNMTAVKKERLESAGWTVGDAGNFLQLTGLNIGATAQDIATRIRSTEEDSAA